MEGGAVGQDGRGREVIHHPAFLYTYYGLVASTDPVWLQGEFDTITGLSDRDGFWTNVGKTYSMLFHPCCAVATQQEVSYEWRMNG